MDNNCAKSFVDATVRRRKASGGGREPMYGVLVGGEGCGNRAIVLRGAIRLARRIVWFNSFSATVRLYKDLRGKLLSLAPLSEVEEERIRKEFRDYVADNRKNYRGKTRMKLREIIDLHFSLFREESKKL